MQRAFQLASLRRAANTALLRGSQDTTFRTVSSLAPSTKGFLAAQQKNAKGSRSIGAISLGQNASQPLSPPDLSLAKKVDNDANKQAKSEMHTSAPAKKDAEGDQGRSDKWKEITVEMWRDAVYTNQTYFGELISDTAEFVKTFAEHIKLGGHRVSLVEVGCGTGEFIRAAAPDFRTVVGVDFNKEFIDFCVEHDVPRRLARSSYLQGDACELYDLLKSEFPQTPKAGTRGVEFWDDTRVVACVGNTIGIIPQELRPRVYEQMAEVAGRDGVLIMVYWNARWFGDACLNFYHKNPNLCGPFEGESVDFKNTTLTTPMNYKTKWTSVEEARALMEDLGMEIISLREKGKGVFVAARRF